MYVEEVVSRENVIVFSCLMVLKSLSKSAMHISQFRHVLTLGSFFRGTQSNHCCWCFANQCSCFGCYIVVVVVAAAFIFTISSIYYTQIKLLNETL
jgi:hypothetical protein